MFDPVVHAALVVVFAWLVQLLFGLLSLDLGNETATGLAQVIVAYILSLFGYSAFKSLVNRIRGVTATANAYKPPFTG